MTVTELKEIIFITIMHLLEFFNIISLLCLLLFLKLHYIAKSYQPTPYAFTKIQFKFNQLINLTLSSTKLLLLPLTNLFFSIPSTSLREPLFPKDSPEILVESTIEFKFIRCEVNGKHYTQKRKEEELWYRASGAEALSKLFIITQVQVIKYGGIFVNVPRMDRILLIVYQLVVIYRIGFLEV